MPASKKDHCDFQENLDFVMKEFSQRLTDDALIIAHSAGASLALALIQSLSKKVNCILVAPTYYQMDGQFAMSNAPRFEKYEKLLQPYRDFFTPDYDLLNKHISSLNIILSDNDLYIPYEQAKQHFSDHFPRACIVTVHK